MRALATAGLLAVAQSCMLAGPAPGDVGPAPAQLSAQTVEFPSSSGSGIHAWLIPGRPGSGAVLLLHGVGSNRTSMIRRAAFLHAAGFAVLAPDFQAHGESPGEHITFGLLESFDAEAALAFLRVHAPGERVGVIGVSMGGAASLVGAKPLSADAFVLESVFPTFHDAVVDRLQTWLGPAGFLGGLIAPVLIGVVGPEVGVNEQLLRPIDRIAHVSVPLLVIAGTADPYTRLAESRALYERAVAPKIFWAVAGAGHEDLHAFAPAEYERRVGDFLASHLRTMQPARSE